MSLRGVGCDHVIAGCDANLRLEHNDIKSKGKVTFVKY